MIIKTLNVTSNFKYLWLKKINGVDLNQHCARCLKGDYIPEINSRVKNVEELKLSDGIYYLCGVSIPYVWKNNFHLAFKTSKGSSISVNQNGIDVIIEDAEQLPISENYINKMLPKSNVKAYYTCRNWQFANYLKETGIF